MHLMSGLQLYRSRRFKNRTPRLTREKLGITTKPLLEPIVIVVWKRVRAPLMKPEKCAI
jgi:hypothetical protein